MKQKVTRWSRPEPPTCTWLWLSAALGGLGLCQLAQLFQLRENSEEAEAWKSGTHSLGSAFLFFSFFRVFVELFNMQFVSFCRELLSEPVTWLPAAPLYNSNSAIWVVIRNPHSFLPPRPPSPFLGAEGKTLKTPNKDDHPFLQLQQSHCISVVYFLFPLRFEFSWAVCVLSRFNFVQLLVTPWTVARQAPLSMGLSRQEYWNGLPFPSPGLGPSECQCWVRGFLKM